VIRDALLRLKPTMPSKKTRRAKPAEQMKSLTRAEFGQKLLALRLAIHLPDTAAGFDGSSDEPIAIEGEPLSETVIRERR